MPVYAALKHFHVACVVVSGLGFVVRGAWMLLDSPRRQARWVRVVPHLVDTLLLGSAISLAVLSGQYPFVVGWLTAKLFGLIAYIGVGAVALRHGRSKAGRVAAFGLALLVYSWIVAVALSRDPRGWLVLLGA